MDILILGGTGVIGQNLVRLLSKKTDISVFVTSRKKHNSYENVHYLQCNAKDLHSIKPILKLRIWDAIIDFMTYKTKDFSSRCGILLGSTKHYFFFSSARVYANSLAPIVEESARLLDISDDNNYLKTDEYALAKAREEDILRKKENKNWTIIRPYKTYDNERLQLGNFEKETWLFRIFNHKTLILDDSILSKETTLTYGYDLAEQIFLLLNNKESFGETYQIMTKQHIKWSRILDLYINIIKKKTEIQPTIKIIHGSALKTGYIYQVKYDCYYDRLFDNKKIVTSTGLNEFTDIERGLSNCLSSFLENAKFRSINWVLQAKMDRESKERTRLRDIKHFKDKIKYLLVRYFFR